MAPNKPKSLSLPAASTPAPMPFSLPVPDRWPVVRAIMEALRPHCSVLPPPRKKFENSFFMEQSRVPVIFETKEGRVRAIEIAARVVHEAVRQRLPNVGTYDETVPKLVSASSLVTRNLPWRTFEADVEESVAARAAYRAKGTKGIACGLTAPRTGNYWFFDEDGKCQYVQLSAAIMWVRFIRFMCSEPGRDMHGSWVPPSIDELGTKEYFTPGGGNMVMW
ncbi:hypothetical protein PENSPDRAFT_695060 [Peniophora sp. CONT]|nr:hypothetical protein PENSPDRAFT_695060 [Peniophora sp. CONT]